MKHTRFLLASATLLTSALYADATHEEAVNKEIGLFFNADFLYWEMHEEGLEFAVSGVKGSSNPSPNSVKKGKAYKPSFKWDPGFRVGAGYIVPERTWDLWLNWTRFRTEGKKSASHSGDPALNPIYSVLDNQGFVLGEVQSSSAKLKMQYNTLDFEVGRRYEILPKLKLRPQIGLRGAWINQDYDIDYLYSNGSGSIAHDQDMDNDFSGLGLRAGLDSQWAITPHFGFFGNISASIVGGKFHVTEEFTETLNTILPPRRGVYVNLHDHFFDLAPEVEIMLGFHLEPGSSKNRYRLEIDLGWEYIVWFNQNQLYLFTSSDMRGVGIRERGNLNFQGLVLSAKLHF
ncbi:MAG: autotransporter domain-containing protein [Chlamydiales bacterium]|nr:autotransporter domain-containing protein [Chlamydiales bacterium]